MSTFKTIPVSDTTYTLFKQRDGAGVDHDKWQRFEGEPSDKELAAVIERHYSEHNVADGWVNRGTHYREWWNAGKTRWRLCKDSIDLARLDLLLLRIDFYTRRDKLVDVEKEVLRETRVEISLMIGADTWGI